MRLYDSAWVRVEGREDQPIQAYKNTRNAALFDIGGFQYDIDGRGSPAASGAPRLLALLSLTEVREQGLASGYDRDIPGDHGGRLNRVSYVHG